MLRINQIGVLLFTISLITTSCDSTRIYDEYAEIGEQGWAKDDAKNFEFNINDTTTFYNVIINVRNSSEYRYKNLYLFVEMTSPSNKFFIDTVEITLADNQGKWLGSGIGNIWQNRLNLIEKAKLLEAGTYRVKVSQGMRHDTLKSLSDVGIRVEKSK
jgi:gliding motility-associated lipoprotein GldH